MSDKNFDPGMKDTCELKEAWADGKKLYYVEDIPGLLEQITCLNKQLAKANERVAELEFQHQLLTKRIEPLLDMQEDGEYYTRCDLADDIYEAFIEGSSVDALNKFATEKKIEGVNDFCATIQGYEDVQPIGANYVTSVAAHRDSFIEQLRNEQE
jgi:hypothetical protein